MWGSLSGSCVPVCQGHVCQSVRVMCASLSGSCVPVCQGHVCQSVRVMCASLSGSCVLCIVYIMCSVFSSTLVCDMAKSQELKNKEKQRNELAFTAMEGEPKWHGHMTLTD